MPEKITNCHTHIFTGDHVPPFLGKTLMPFPLYYIVNIKLLIYLVRSWDHGWIGKLYYGIKRPVDRFIFWWQGLTEHNLLKKMIAWLIKFCIVAVCFIFMISFLYGFFEDGWIKNIFTWFLSIPFVAGIASMAALYKIVILLSGFILVKWVRNMVKLLLLAAFKFLKFITGPANTQLLKRYYNIALFSKDRSQEYIFSVLRKSYPAGSEFVILPMDMDYAGAGKPKYNYLQQLEDLVNLKSKDGLRDIMKPFVFADPRRIKETPGYYAKMIECLEVHKFSGIKIYPALGYYPFDKYLLELFLYACKKQIPVLTHCIRGVIFYRGLKKKEWDHHPVFTETKEGTGKLRLTEFKNIDFINNFTHPLNYLCLLDPTLLRKVLFDLEYDDYTKKIYELYGFVKETSPENSVLENDLQNLKLCFGHFGGEDEWAKYLGRDLGQYDNDFAGTASYWQDFHKYATGAIWHRETWYSVIRNIIMNPSYPNVYADISFIIYDENILSLLKSSLRVEKLQDRILYGTDFYVVRQKGTDKKFWVDILAHLSEEEIRRITYSNPASFLKNEL